MTQGTAPLLSTKGPFPTKGPFQLEGVVNHLSDGRDLTVSAGRLVKRPVSTKTIFLTYVSLPFTPRIHNFAKGGGNSSLTPGFARGSSLWIYPLVRWLGAVELILGITAMRLLILLDTWHP